jgi:hypothetical protein
VREADPVEPACKRWGIATLVASTLAVFAVSACYAPPKPRWVGIEGRTIGVNQETGTGQEKTEEGTPDASPEQRTAAASRCVIDSPRGKETLLLRTRDEWRDLSVEGGFDGPDPEATPGLDGVRVPNGSRCELLEQARGLTRIRVLDGPLASANGWVESAAAKLVSTNFSPKDETRTSP